MMRELGLVLLGIIVSGIAMGIVVSFLFAGSFYLLMWTLEIEVGIRPLIATFIVGAVIGIGSFLDKRYGSQE